MSQYLTTLKEHRKTAVYAIISIVIVLFTISIYLSYEKNKKQEQLLSNEYKIMMRRLEETFITYDENYKDLITKLNKIETNEHDQIILQVSEAYKRAPNIKVKIEIINKYKKNIEEIVNSRFLNASEKYILQGILNKFTINKNNINNYITEINTKVEEFEDTNASNIDNLKIQKIK